MRLARQGTQLGRGFTLLELLVVVAIIAVLAVLVVPNAGSLLNRAQAPVCSARLLNLWTVFSNHLQDGQPWPQLPTNITVGSIEEQQWWLDQGSNSLGLTVRDWNCPTISRMISGSTNQAARTHLISYLPMLFDATPSTPTRWPSMPWFTEIANVHGKGAQMIRGDGAVVTAPPAAPHP
jgi:prepilin-type N-terminal cleavage/methylation domain-containing protein